MTETAIRKFRMPPGKWSLRSAAWAIPVGLVFAPPIGLVVVFSCLFFCVGTLGPDPVEPPIPPWRKSFGDVVIAPGMVMSYFYPKDAFAHSPRLIQRGTEFVFFGFPYSWSFFFLLFTVLGFTPLNRERKDFKNTEQSE